MTKKRNDIEVEDVTSTSQYDGLQVLKDAHSLPGHYIRTKESLTLVKPHFDTISVVYDTDNNPTEVSYLVGTKPHTTSIGFTDDVSGDKENGYVLLSSGRNEKKYALYITIDGSGTPPSLEGVTNIEIPLSINDPASIITSAYELAINNIGEFKVNRKNNVLDITTLQLGVADNTTEVGTGFIISNDLGEEQEVEKVLLTYSSNGHPIWQGQELINYDYNIYTGRFERTTAAETINSNGDVAIRVVITDPADEEASAPTNILLNGELTISVLEGQPTGSVLGTLTSTSSNAVTYSIEQDLSNAFQISGDQLLNAFVFNSTTQPIYNVVIRVTDNVTGKFSTQGFTINVVEAGGFANSLSFDFRGGSNYIVVPTPQYSSEVNMSWFAWIKYDAKPTSSQYIFNSQNGNNQGGISLRLLDGTNDIQFIVRRFNNNQKDYRYILPVDYDFSKWHLWGFTFADNDIKLYIDGALQTPSQINSDQVVPNINTTQNNTYIGANSDGTDEFFVGKMSGITLCRNVLSNAQFISVYNAGVQISNDTALGAANYDHEHRATPNANAPNDPIVNIVDTKGDADAVGLNIFASGDVPIAYTNTISTLFDGVTNAFIGVGSDTIDFSLAKTFVFWVKRGSPLQTDYLFSNRATNSSNNGWSFYYDGNSAQRFYFEIQGASTGVALRARWELGAATQDAWVQIAVTMPAGNLDVNNVELYLNGSLVGRTNLDNDLPAIPSFVNQLSIGAGTTGEGKINATVNEIQVYDAELSQSQIQELYNLGVPNDAKLSSVGSDLIQRWRMGNNNGLTASMTDDISDDEMVMTGFSSSFYVGDTP